MRGAQKASYHYNPHQHIKIWLSNNRQQFMNAENQLRLISMRETNEHDVIHLLYDSCLLDHQAVVDLHSFCDEHTIKPIDADQFLPLLASEKELKLYQYYKDEITHLKEGGNLAVASDIIRWLPQAYLKGTYTDFDVPVDTRALPQTLLVDAPILLNIGSLRLNDKEIILSNNDFIAVVDPLAAKQQIDLIQEGLLSLLSQYTNDFIEKTKSEFGNSLLNQCLLVFLQHRSEAIYIERSKSIFTVTKPHSSRALRHAIQQLMTNQDKFIDFKRQSIHDTQQSIINDLRGELKKELSLLKRIFFNPEYQEIRGILNQPDDSFVQALMQREKTLYLKSIVVCTTGPIAIAKLLFNGYVFTRNDFNSRIVPYSFNHYDLNRAFQSKNSIPIHEHALGMMRFLGREDGALNDLSWLDNGAQLQQNRAIKIEQHKIKLKKELPDILLLNKQEIEQQLQKLHTQCHGFAGLFSLDNKKAQITALTSILGCFKQGTFDTVEFKKVLEIISCNQDKVYPGFLYSRTKKIIASLEHNCANAILYSVVKNKKIDLVSFS